MNSAINNLVLNYFRKFLKLSKVFKTLLIFAKLCKCFSYVRKANCRPMIHICHFFCLLHTVTKYLLVSIQCILTINISTNGIFMSIFSIYLSIVCGQATKQIINMHIANSYKSLNLSNKCVLLVVTRIGKLMFFLVEP